jgi:hypothetical protein
VMAHPGDAPDDGGDAVKGPQVGVEAVGLGALQQCGAFVARTRQDSMA